MRDVEQFRHLMDFGVDAKFMLSLLGVAVFLKLRKP